MSKILAFNNPQGVGMLLKKFIKPNTPQTNEFNFNIK